MAQPNPAAGLDSRGANSRQNVGYTVVARRYRPQYFDDVVGQDHVVRALKNAIELNRVTHAYLFCGTRGVGKTSLARIFAKCLNCEKGPTVEPCQVCDVCRAISTGQDVDVIEIDGASNNGVDAVRELRQNANLRPSRARYKIYYIDEVHMLTIGAFNALLKTLEEPPEHVKFLFATTEVNKIPITILSRCQRYDFASILPDQILATLASICRSEGVEADDEALQVVARRAAGSMRDAQSLLERLLSSGIDSLTADRVHQLLGTASDDRVLDIVEALARRQPAQALVLLEQGAAQGVQPVDVLNGVMEFLRDVMVLSVSPDVPLQSASPRQKPKLLEIAQLWSIDSILAALQIFSDARIKLRGNPYGRLLIELALVRVARLEDLSELSEEVARLAALENGGPPPAPSSNPLLSAAPNANENPDLKKKSVDAEAAASSKSRSASMPTAPSPPPTSMQPPSPSAFASHPRQAEPPQAGGRSTSAGSKTAKPIDLAQAAKVWNGILERHGLRELVLFRCRLEAGSSPFSLALTYPADYNPNDVNGLAKLQPKIQETLRQSLDLPSLDLELQVDTTDAQATAISSSLHLENLTNDPDVRRAMEMFELRVVSAELESSESSNDPDDDADD